MPNKKQFNTLRLILGDQLNARHSWFDTPDDNVVYLLAELHQEANYVDHHIQKITAFFMAMESFANMLEREGHKVLRLTLDQTKPFANLAELLDHIARKYQIKHFEYQQPDEFRLEQQLDKLVIADNVTKKKASTEHFLLTAADLERHFSENKAHQMEFFYRRMRKQFNLLMDGDKPAGGRWNFDPENRKKIPKKDLALVPAPLTFDNDQHATVARIKKHKIKTIGDTQSNLIWPINHSQSQKLLAYFCENLLPYFGQFQDAMTCHSESHWSLYHSRLSFSLNTKMLHPMTVIKTAIEAYEASKGSINLAQIEGFVRQLLGWREFVRGIYWANMPSYASKNFFNAQRPLPPYFWTADTRMKCVSTAIGQSLSHSYAHHIQRLMITGNFCLLSDIHPDEVDRWYLGIYVDAIEWVEMPNTRGMSQFADGGLLASKPYCASANYINKMSDYCSSCQYNPKLKTGSSACPFNSLYWRFLDKNQNLLQSNRRMSMIYRNWYKQSAGDRQQILSHAQWCIDHVDTL